MTLQNFDFLIKIVLTGDSNVGKTSILSVFSGEVFPTDYMSTIGVDFKVKSIKIDDTILKLQLWDTAGQERFRSIVTSYYRGADIILIVFDLTDRISYQNLTKWISEVKHHSHENIVCAILGNKCENPHVYEVAAAEIQHFAQTQGLKYFPVSAKTQSNIQEAFSEVLRTWIAYKRSLPLPAPNPKKQPTPARVNLCQFMPTENSSSKCC